MSLRKLFVFLLILSPFMLRESLLRAEETDKLAASFTDGKATISHVMGTVKVLHFGSEEWIPVSENDSIDEGDQVKTDADSSADIIYDDSALNLVHLDQNTIAEFPTIEPTVVYLSDGSVYNTLGALPEGQDYEVATDTAVNAIRGTEFLRTFDAGNKTDTTSVTEGTVESFATTGNAKESVMISKDNSLTLTPQLLEKSKFSEIHPQPISPEHREKIQQFSQGLQANLEHFTGGPEALKQKREQARTEMAKPEFHDRLMEQRQQFVQKRQERMAEMQNMFQAKGKEGMRRPGEENGNPGVQNSNEKGPRVMKPSEMGRPRPNGGPNGPGQMSPERHQSSGPQQGMSRPGGQRPGPRAGGPGPRSGGGGPRPAPGRRR